MIGISNSLILFIFFLTPLFISGSKNGSKSKAAAFKICSIIQSNTMANFSKEYKRENEKRFTKHKKHVCIKSCKT